VLLTTHPQHAQRPPRPLLCLPAGSLAAAAERTRSIRSSTTSNTLTNLLGQYKDAQAEWAGEKVGATGVARTAGVGGGLAGSRRLLRWQAGTDWGAHQAGWEKKGEEEEVVVVQLRPPVRRG
jgi:hypothetical protein